jgi:xylulokinase
LVLREIVLTADLGAGSLRVGAVTPTGQLVAVAGVPITAAEPHPGWSEIDPEIWWRAFGTATAAVLQKLRAVDHVVGLCLSSLTRSQVFLDRDARPLRPAILFRDRRASDEAVAVAQHFVGENPADAITPFHPLARLAWFARQEPRLFERLHAVAEPKDFLNLRLTGKNAVDTITASRYDGLRPTGSLPAWLERCANLMTVERRAPWAILGSIVCREAPFDRLAGVPVFCGAMDAWATAIGAGAVHPGQAYDIAGTSEVVGLITRARATATGLVSLVWTEDSHQIGGPTQIGADCAVWCHERFRIRGGLKQAVERAGRRPPSDAMPVFLPYLAGERAPLWRDDVSGMFHGLSRQHGPDDFLWAALEGVAQAVRDILATATAATGVGADEIRICGGGARSDAWCQLKADVLGVPVLRSIHRETGLVGTATAAWVGLGRHPNLAAAAARMCPIECRFEPQRGLAPFYLGRAALYRQVKAAALALADPRSAMPNPGIADHRLAIAAEAGA